MGRKFGTAVGAVVKDKVFWFCLVVAAGVLAVCTKSSFLYPLNDWVDSNCFYTVGKAMVHGKVLYRDIYEQKGPFCILSMGWGICSHRIHLPEYIFWKR